MKVYFYKMKKNLLPALLCLLGTVGMAQFNGFPTIKITSTKSSNSFPIVDGASAATIYYDTADAKVVGVVANAFQQDVALVTGIKPSLQSSGEKMGKTAIIIGSISHSSLIKQLIQSKKLSVADIAGKWESFSITTIQNPFPGVAKALVVAGSDARGTAYGVFEISKLMGVSPWYWWADVVPEHKASLYVLDGTQVNGEPSVKYRGIFINDEDWGMQPWAAKKMDTDIKDIGPNTYAHIFELLLRLKANFIWPAMHPCTKAFYYYKDNAMVADKYGIVVGTSHCEPMLRNNVFEWAENYKNEYGVAPNEWRYDVNKAQIAPYWRNRIEQVKDYESVITVGMRGVHDGSMPGPKDMDGKRGLLETIIADQREILTNTYKKPMKDIPQIFCPYKEVLDVYRSGLKLPEDVTIVWSDDNHGYINQLSNKQELGRSGGSGVYYHFSYWGAPQDFLWLSSVSPSLTSYEMTKAYSWNAKKLWVFNVGDLKPAEMEISFAMDLAYNIDQWQPEKAIGYSKHWAAETFGEAFAAPIAAIKNEYYQLAQAGKPEHLLYVNYSDADAEARLLAYDNIAKQAEQLYKQMPNRLKDAFYELVLYPVKGACLMNQKILFARKSIAMAKQGDKNALAFSNKALAAYKEIDSLTIVYNKLNNGKWNGMMSAHPRNQLVFKMPNVATDSMINITRDTTLTTSGVADKLTVIKASQWANKHDAEGKKIVAIEGLGIGGSGVTILPATGNSSQVAEAPYIDYTTEIKEGTHQLTVKSLPTHSINNNYQLRYAISVNGDKPQVVNLNVDAGARAWSKNVLNGYSAGTTEHKIAAKKQQTSIRIYLLDPGLVINQIEVQ